MHTSVYVRAYRRSERLNSAATETGLSPNPNISPREAIDNGPLSVLH